MSNVARAVVQDGKIELLDEIELPEGAQLLVTLVSDDDDREFWLSASLPSMKSVWDNAEDDVYEQLLKD